MNRPQQDQAGAAAPGAELKGCPEGRSGRPTVECILLPVRPISTSSSELEALSERILIRAGASPSNAALVAHHLALANASGMASHGVLHLPGYVRDIQAGLLQPKAVPSVRYLDTSAILIEGNWTFGQVAGMEALSKAIEAAEAVGIAASGVVACHHLGRLGHYAEIAATRGYVLLVWVGGQGEEEPHAAPHGGRSRVIGTNPIAFGFPGGQENAITYDFATTGTAGTKILNARDRGGNLPAGCIIDRDGHPSTDPADFFAGGAHVPFGGHKGYAIALSAEWLGRILLGADRFTVAGRGTPILRHQGALFVVIRANLFAPLEIVSAASDATYERIGNSLPRPGYDEVLLPGQPEVRARSLSDEKGIEIDAETWAEIARLEETL